MASNPSASLSIPNQALIGETLNFSVGFTNTSPTDPGYGPYVDLYLPSTGADGAGAAVDDGITFSGATYLGTPVTSTVLAFDAAGHATHPYAKDALGLPLVVNGTPGDELVVLQLPFGSFTPGQPTATIDVAAAVSNLADVGAPLGIQARGGFRYGNDALDNPTTDPSVIGTTASAAVTPTLMTLKTTYIGPEDETATGPNFPRQYLVTVDVANGQTLTNLDVTDILPAKMQFVRVDATTIRGTPTATTAEATPSLVTPGGTLTRRFASVTGTTAANDATLLFTYFIPRDNSAGNPILNPSTGAPTLSIDDAQAQGNWTPIDTRDPMTLAVSNAAANDHTLTDRSLATQKSVALATDIGAPGPSPGDTLQYTIQAQVSDYFAFRNLLLADVLSDGQHVDPTFTPTLLVNGNPFSLSAGGFSPTNYTVEQNYTGAVAVAPVYTLDPAPNDGTSTVRFRISDEMVTRGQDGNLLGGLVPAGGGALLAAPGDGPTTFTVVFRTVIQDQFTDDYPSGEAFVDHNDVLDDNVTVQGEVLNNADLSPTGSTVTDTSAAQVSIVAGNLTQNIYAVNGITAFTSPVKIAAGDSVTYRIRYTLPTSNEEQLSLYDYLPLPIFNALSVTSFDNVGGSGSATVIPAPGHANFGPADTFRPLSGLVPTLSADPTSNALKFSYPNYKDPANSSTTIDLLFTVQAGSQPFADGLFLSTQARVVEGSTNAGSDIQDRIIQVQLTEPLLKISKGIIATDNSQATFSPATVGPVSFSAPGSAGYRGSGTIGSTSLAAKPINSNVSKIDAGDLVTFAIVVENNGSGLHGAFDVRFRDTLPAGFAIPSGGLNLQVTDGSGLPIGYSSLGTGLFDPAGGIELLDSIGTGAIADYAGTGGQNLAVITYDLQAVGSVTPNQSLTNTATLFNYATTEGGPDFTSVDLTDTAVATVATPTLSKVLSATDQTFTTGSNLAIGEVATYTVTITVPEGITPSAVLKDTLPAGLAIVGLDSITASPSLDTSVAGGFSSVLAGAMVGPNGSSATFDFGTLTNLDTNNATAETITVVYRAVALNVSGNANGTGLSNSARFSYTGGSKTSSASATVVTPLLKVVKSINSATADAGDTVTFTLVLSHAAASAADAFDVVLDDLLPAGLSYVPGSLLNTAGQMPTSLTESGGTISAIFDTFAQGSTSTLTFQATVGGGVGAFQTITNVANVTYTSLPGVVATPISSYNTVSTERTGSSSDPGGTANNLINSGSTSVTVTAPALSKAIVGTSQPFTAGTSVAIGETIRYRVTITVPEGMTPGASLVDTLPAGLAIVSVDGISASAALSTSVPGGFANVLSGAVVGANGSSVTWDFGTLSNADRDNLTAETIVLDYTVVALNSLGNQAGANLVNTATFFATGGSSMTSAPALTVVEPVLQVTKTPSSPTGDAGAPPITFTLVVAHAAGSTADAFNVNLDDIIPAGFTYVPGSLANTAGLAPTMFGISGGTISATFDAFALGSTSTIRFQAILNATTSPAQAITNTASLNYSSLPGDVTAAVSSYNSLSTERTGSAADPGGGLNDYVTSGSGTVTVNANTISGFVYIDANSNGSKGAGEPGIAGATVTLAGSDNLGNVVTVTATTTASGAYTFINLRPGTYTLTETQPGGYLDGQESLGTPFGGSAATSDTFTALTIPLGTNPAGANYNFGELRPASVAGTVFSDANNDGVKQAGESGIAGVSVTLTGTDDLGNAVATTVTTGASGGFSFTNLRPGTYTLNESQPGGYFDGKDATGNTGGTLANDQVGGFVLVENQARSGVLFGELAPASLAGVVYLDANNDGVKQAGESGLAGVLITLTGTDDLGNTVNLATSTVSGAYVFNGLRPGTYVISESQPAGFLDGKDTAGTTGGTTSTNDVIGGIALGAGINGANNNFGELLPSSLSGFVFSDANNDGVKQAGEAGILGASVTLTGTDDLGNPITTTATTAMDGSYTFAGLRPGTYTLNESQPTGYLDGNDTAGTLGGTVSNDQIAGITLAQGTSGTGYTFGELLPGTLSGRVYNDANNDGQSQLSESGILGATVTLTGTDDRGNGVSVVATTLADGSYAFTNLRPGLYTLTETQPTGYLDGDEAAGTLGGTVSNDQIAGIALGVGGIGANNTFGELAPSSLAGVIFSDANNDGIKQAGESGLVGETVTLTGTDDRGNPVNILATTVAGGSYQFTNLRPGTYTLTESQPSGYLDGQDALGSLGGTASNDQFGGINIGVGVAGTAYTFGELAPASLAGIVYLDANNDGVTQAGESGLAGVTVTLTGTDDLGQTITLPVTTAGDGTYSFTSLRPGTYTITEDQPITFLDGKDAAGSLGGTLSNDRVAGIVVQAGDTGTAYTFGELAPASLAGLVFDDSNNDGVRQAGESGIVGVTVTLTGTDDRGNSLSLPITTAADGTYAFAGLRPGTYTVTETQPAAYLDGLDAAGSLSGALSNDRVGGIVVQAGDTGTAYTFGELAPATLVGVVYSDANNDGVKQAGEAGIAGVMVTLTGTDDLGIPVSLSVPTAADGSFDFTNLRPGSYTLTESQPTGFLDGQDAAGDTGGTVSNDLVTNITLAPGGTGGGVAFGELAPAGLSGFVYRDINLSGAREPGEPGIASVTVTLTGTDDLGNAVSLPTLTDAAGRYSFPGLRPGTYTLTETQPAAYLDGDETVGTQGGLIAGDDLLSALVLTPGLLGTGNNFGELTPSSLAGSVYADANNNGVRDAGESGIPGVTLSLSGTDDRGNPVSGTVVTAADGSYVFTNLRPGTYTLTETQPTSYLDGQDAVGTLGGSLANDVIGSIVLGEGVAGVGNTFGELVPAALSGSVFRDANNDGVRQVGELGLPGVTLTLTGTDDLGISVSQMATSLADGSYSFTNLRPGTYSVSEVQPTGLLDGRDAAGTAGGTVGDDRVDGIVLFAGTDAAGYTFGELDPASLAGVVFRDDNNDGIEQPLELGIAGVSVTLTGTDDLGNSVTLSTLTASDGSYLFSNLRPSGPLGYTLTETQPADTSTARTYRELPARAPSATTRSRASSSPPAKRAPATPSAN